MSRLTDIGYSCSPSSPKVRGGPPRPLKGIFWTPPRISARTAGRRSLFVQPLVQKKFVQYVPQSARQRPVASTAISFQTTCCVDESHRLSVSLPQKTWELGLTLAGATDEYQE